MGVFKEEVGALEWLARKQVRIYPDSADYGVYATKSVRNTVRWAIQNLPGNMAKPLWKFDHANITQRFYETTVEWGGGDATHIHVLYVNDRPKQKEFFSISLNPVRKALWPCQDSAE